MEVQKSKKSFLFVWVNISFLYINPFMTEGCYHIENSPLICSANQWTGFYLITVSVMKGLKWFLFIGNISFMRSVDRPLLILYISVAKTWIFRSWIETKPSFSNEPLNDDCLSWYVILRYLSWSGLWTFFC